MITTIIFSKDRPLQLDLCLKSIKKNCHDCNEIIVIEKYSQDYLESLETLKHEHPEVTFYKQGVSIYMDVRHNCLISKNKLISFFTDDNIFYAGFSTNDFYQILYNPDFPCCCISLRLGKNISKRFHQSEEEADLPLHGFESGGFLVVPKTKYPYGSYWSYSHSVDGHIFRKEDIMHMMSELEYLDKKFKFKQTPNEFETQMQRFWPLSHNLIVCPYHSVVVNSPNNRVSDSHNDNVAGETYSYTNDFLLGKYVRGKRIDIELLDFNNIVCPHQEINILEGIT